MVSLCIHTSHFLIGLLSVLLFFLIVTSKCLSVAQFAGSDADTLKTSEKVLGFFGKDVLRAEVILVCKLAWQNPPD